MESMLSPEKQRQILAKATRSNDSLTAMSHFNRDHGETAGHIGKSSMSAAEFAKKLSAAGHDHHEIQSLIEQHHD